MTSLKGKDLLNGSYFNSHVGPILMYLIVATGVSSSQLGSSMGHMLPEEN